MSLDKHERRVLVLAREKIADGSQKYICTALAVVRDIDGLLWNAANRIQGYICNSLNDSHSLSLYLEDWQRKNGFAHRTHQQCRADRLAWIDWMLDQPEVE